MKPLSRSMLVVLALLAVPSLAAWAAGVTQSDFPNKPIRWVIPFPPGGSNDLLSRFLSAKLTDRLGQQLVVDNRGGANGIIGAEMVATAPPDGYTLLMISTSFVMNAAVRSLPYDVEKSFDPVSMIGSSPNSIVVFPGFGVNSLRELVDRARAAPGKINYASTGVGGFNHFGGELFKKLVGIDMVMVPYKGGGPAMIDVMSGHVPVMFTSITQVLPHVRTGRIRMLAVGAAKRIPAVPDVPTVAEAGFPGYEVTVWWGVSAPAGVPRPVMEKLRREFTTLLKEPETQKLLANDAAEVRLATPAEFRKFIHDEVRKWTGVARDAGIRVQ
ncbi:MAG TPA: tripartite tricarboxylate transporter substrate binding protein [Burkholderiales bacterium]|nr:tripartite tricarboxylate transporter substrate binding protein [Burkholderiales bacterium]